MSLTLIERTHTPENPISKKNRELTINYQDINGNLSQLSAEQACVKFGLNSWVNTILDYNNQEAYADHMLNWYILESMETQEKIAIKETKIHNNLEYGLVALETITKDSKLIYASKLVCNTDANDLYAVATDNRTIISAKNNGNMTRFMNHAPNDTEALHFYNSEDRTNVATANFATEEYETPSIGKYLILKAKYDIQPKEILYWDYGPDYFQHTQIPVKLFNKHGNIIEPSKYRWINPYINLNIDNKYMPFAEKFTNIISSETIFNIKQHVSDNAVNTSIIINTNFFRETLKTNPELLSNYNIILTLPKNDNQWIKYRYADEFCLKKETINYIKDNITGNVLKTPIGPEKLIQTKMQSNDNSADIFKQKLFHYLGIAINQLEFMAGKSLKDLGDKFLSNDIRYIIDDRDSNNKILYIALSDIFKKLPSRSKILQEKQGNLSSLSIFNKNLENDNSNNLTEKNYVNINNNL